jgi:signal transduction histidine kinase
LCDQERETIQHILATCVFARYFWFLIFDSLGMNHLAPRADERSFEDWWRKASKSTRKDKRKGINCVIILGF